MTRPTPEAETTVRCGNCKKSHKNPAEVRACYAAAGKFDTKQQISPGQRDFIMGLLKERMIPPPIDCGKVAFEIITAAYSLKNPHHSIPRIRAAIIIDYLKTLPHKSEEGPQTQDADGNSDRHTAPRPYVVRNGTRNQPH